MTTDRGLDYVIIEEPLSLRIGGAVLTLMRTPGRERELAAGFCLSEGIIRTLSDISTLTCHEKGGPFDCDTVEVTLCEGAAAGNAEKNENARGLYNSHIKRDVLMKLPRIMREHQPLFAKTGAAHAAAFFSANGDLVICREDIGRLNALDKAIGHLFLNNIEISDKVLMLSGRVSHKLAAKAARAGCKIMAAVSAPTSLAVEFAENEGITLVGFLRGKKMNVYTHPERLQ